MNTRAIAGGLEGPGPPFGEKVQQIHPFTPLILRIFLLFCIYLTLFNIIIPKNFQPFFTQHNFIPLLPFLSMHIQKFCWGLQGYKPGYPLFVYT